MRLLVYGGRDCSKFDVWNWLERNAWAEIAHKTGRQTSPPLLKTLIHGGARGADEGGADWGRSEHANVNCFKANWRKHGKAAGPIRNQQMIDEGQPDIAIAFPGGKGTADMTRRLEAAGIPIVFARGLTNHKQRGN